MDSTEADGLYGDVDALIASFEAGLEEQAFKLKDHRAHEWLAEHRGLSTDAEPQAPEELPPLEDEFQTEGDVWEDY